MKGNKVKSNNHLGLWLVISVLVVSTLWSSFMFVRDLKKLNAAYEDLNNIEFINSSTQRLVRLAITNQMDDKVLFFIGDRTESALHPYGDMALSVLSDVDIVVVTSQVLENWYALEKLLINEDANQNSLILAGDSHFHSMTDLTIKVGEYSTELNENIVKYQASMVGLFFCIGLLLLHSLMRAQTELKQSKALAKNAQIDIATGLYNRTRCRDLFKMNPNPATKKQPAMLVLDLNDLKITNDTFGHRVGDELIHYFAQVLKGACNVHVVPPFVGRYGGDEFIVFYEDIPKEEEIQIFIKELNFLIKQVNDRESRYQISYAVGHCFISQHSNAKITIRQMFDQADEAMYINKIMVKKARDPNYKPPNHIPTE